MAREFSRTDRVAQQIQKEIAVIMQREIKDPRLSMATVCAVEVTRDLAHAKVFVSFFENDQDKIDQSLAILNDASGYVRGLLAKRVRVRSMPNLRFFYDNSLVEGVRMSQLVDQAIDADKAKQAENGDAEGNDA